MGKMGFNANESYIGFGQQIEMAFNCVGCDISYYVDYDVGHKLAKFQSICGTICQVLSRKQGKRVDENFVR